MPTIICPSCKQSYDVEPEVIGKKVQCAICNESFIAHRNRSKQQNSFIPKNEQHLADSQQFCFTQTPHINQQNSPYYVNNEPRFNHPDNIPPSQEQIPFDYRLPQNLSCPQQQVVYVQSPSKAKSRSVYVMLGLFFGTLGVHDFYAGDIGRGVTHFVLALLGASCFVAASSYFIDLLNNHLIYYDISAFILIGKIIGLVNLLWALYDTIFIKDDGKGTPME